MSWQIADKSAFPCVKNFLSEHECGSVSFSARFKALAHPGERNRERSAVVIDKERNTGLVTSAILVTQGGLLLPVFGDAVSVSAFPEKPVLKEMLSQFSEILHSVMGTTKSVAMTQSLFERNPSDRVDYYLLSLDRQKYKCPESSPSIPITIRQATVKDADRLFPLQKKYELEEVYIDPSRFNERFCMSNLKETLKREIVLVAESDGMIIAKAGTNARGYLFDQIGGVYTVTDERRKGVGTALMGALVENIFKRRMRASLFVKKNNAAAVTMYTKLGFSFEDDFAIAYYFDTAGRGE